MMYVKISHMKKVVSIIIASICMVFTLSCSKNANTEYTVASLPDSIANAPYIDDAASWLDSTMTGQHILINARVSSVSACRKYCILTGSSKKVTIRLDANGKINGFNKELTGCEVVVSGKLQEKRFGEAELRSHKSDLLKMIETYMYTAKSDTTGVERYSNLFSELREINEMIKWIESNNYSQYSTLSIDCEDYVVLN